jgi:hypothetical protein
VVEHHVANVIVVSSNLITRFENGAKTQRMEKMLFSLCLCAIVVYIKIDAGVAQW